jgi:MFS superfamily sulfate permease-like transporter
MRNLSQSALAAIVIMAAVSLFDVEQLRKLFAMRKDGVRPCGDRRGGRRRFRVTGRIVIAVALSIAQFFARFWRPYSAVLGKPEGIEASTT